MTVAGTYYAPASSCAIDVAVQLENDDLRVFGEGVQRLESLRACPLSEPLGRMARHFTLPDGARIEISDIETLAGWERTTRRSTGMHLVHRLESRWRWVAGAAVFLSALIAALYLWGLPLAAKQVAMRLPPQIAKMATEQARSIFVTLFEFESSKIPEERRTKLSAAFLKMAAAMDPGSKHEYRLEFFKAPFPNAFALPDGLVCITDELIEEAENDTEVLGVLAHEIVHVREQHGLRNVLQDSAVFLIWTLMTGDISTVAGMGSALPAMLAQSGYTRAFEQEADLGAAKHLVEIGWGVQPLCDLLERIDPEASHSIEAATESLSSHPLTIKRIHALKDYEAAHRKP